MRDYDWPTMETRQEAVGAAPTLKALWIRMSRLASRVSAMACLLRANGDRLPLVLAGLIILTGTLPFASIHITRRLIDSLVATTAAASDRVAPEPLLFWVAAAAAVWLVQHLSQSGLEWVRTIYSEQLQDHITGRIHEQSALLDLSFYESSDFFNRLHRARDEAVHRPASLVQNVSELLQSVITLCAMSVALTSLGLWLPVALFISAVPALYVVARFGLVEQQVKRRTSSVERRAWYLDEMLVSAPHAAELRLFDLGAHFRQAHARVRASLRSERVRLARDRSLAGMAAGVAAAVIVGGVGIFMLRQAVAGIITLGQLAASYQAFGLGLATMRSLLSGIGALYTNSVFLDDLFDFLALRPQITNPLHPQAVPPTRAVTVRFRDVSFRYPGTHRPVIDGFNLEIPARKISAIVGPNGAGKSTLLKLLGRLYDPDLGSIELNGIDARNLDLRELRSMMTMLFQEPAKYWESVVDNVGLGSVATAPSRSSVERAMMAAGAASFVSELSEGFETVLGRRFGDGADLSTGQWQQLALARAFVRDCPILALDEPTSALDPWAEADWFDRFRRAAAGRTALLITHRLSTARHADVIHVMRNGRIIESGSHDALLQQRGMYAASWRSPKHDALSVGVAV